MKKILEKCMDSLAKQDMIFSNEQDFQFALARELDKKKYNISEIKLEVLTLTNKNVWKEAEKMGKNPKKTSKEYTDIIVKYNNKYYAIELKYKTTGRVCVYGSENNKIITMRQANCRKNKKLFEDDIKKLKGINKRCFGLNIKIKKGYAVLLTNNSNYWENKKWLKNEDWKTYKDFDENDKKISPSFKYILKEVAPR